MRLVGTERQIAHVAAKRDQSKSHSDKAAGQRRLDDIDRGVLAGGPGARGDVGHRPHNVVETWIDGGADRPRNGEIRRADQNAIDTLDVQYVVQCLERGACLDHREGQCLAIGAFQPLRGGACAVARHGEGRPPRSLSQRGIFDGCGEGARILDRVHHRSDHGLGSEVEHAAGDIEAAHGNAHQRRLAGGHDGSHAAQHAVLVHGRHAACPASRRRNRVAASASTTRASGREDQAEKSVSPAFSRDESMKRRGFGIRIFGACGGEMAVDQLRRTSSIACCSKLVHGAPDLVIGLIDAGGVEIGPDLAEDVLVPGLLEIGFNDRQMNRRRRIYEGKAKVLYEGPEPGTLIQHFKDDATAFNAKKHEVIDGKGVLNNRISEYIFQHLNDIGVPTHFIRRLNMREQLIREVEIIPLEVVVRNVAAGSLSKRSASRKARSCRARSSNSTTRTTSSTIRWSPKSTSPPSAGRRPRRSTTSWRSPSASTTSSPASSSASASARRLQDGDAAGCGRTT
jgi:hypothetical protein